MNRSDFNKAVQATIPCVERPQLVTRDCYGLVYLVSNGSSLSLYGADGFVLTRQTIPASFGAWSCLVHPRGLRAILAACKGTAEIDLDLSDPYWLACTFHCKVPTSKVKPVKYEDAWKIEATTTIYTGHTAEIKNWPTDTAFVGPWDKPTPVYVMGGNRINKSLMDRAIVRGGFVEIKADEGKATMIQSGATLATSGYTWRSLVLPMIKARH